MHASSQNRTGHAAATLGAACLAATLAAAPAAAQDAPWQFAMSPYLWVAGIKGTAVTSASRVDFDISFADTLKDLSGVPVMLGGEVRNGRASVAFDIMWLKVKSDIDTPRNLLFNDGSARMSTLQASAIGFYRAIERPEAWVEGGAGFRLWSVSAKASLNPGILPATTGKFDKTFVDPVVAVRAEFRVADRWSISAHGDIGGFGIGSDVTWQAIGTVNYRANDWAIVRLGWRHLAVDRDKITVDMTGPIFVSTFRF